MSLTGDACTSRRRRGSESMWRSSIHAAQTLVPSVVSKVALHTERNASSCCGTRCRMAPTSSSLLANSRIVSSSECCAMRVGNACGSKRAVEVTMNTRPSRPRASTSATRDAVSIAMLATGSESRRRCRSRQTRLATPSATATDTTCEDHAAARSPRLLRVVCCPPPHVFLALCTTDDLTLFDHMPAAASCVASRGSTGS